MRAPPPFIAHLHLDLTNRCHFRCEFCFQNGDLDAKRGFMDRVLAERIIDEAVDKGLAREMSTAVFGEALLHPEFFPIAEHAVRRGLRLTLNTKGDLLRGDTAERVCASGIHKLIISLNTHDESTYGINQGPPKQTFAEHAAIIEHAIETKLRTESPIQIFLYLMNTSFARPRGLDIISDEATARAAVERWHGVAAALATRYGVAPPAPVADLVRGGLLDRKWPIDRGLRLLDGVELVLKEAHSFGNRIIDPALEPVPTTTGYCPLPFMMLTVHWDGDCSLCCLDFNRDVVVGNLRDSSLEEIFLGERMSSIRRRMTAGHIDEPLCQTCLGGLRDRKTGEMVRRPQSSPTARVLATVEKYGIRRSLEYAWTRLRERVD